MESFGTSEETENLKKKCYLSYCIRRIEIQRNSELNNQQLNKF